MDGVAMGCSFTPMKRCNSAHPSVKSSKEALSPHTTDSGVGGPRDAGPKVFEPVRFSRLLKLLASESAEPISALPDELIRLHICHRISPLEHLALGRSERDTLGLR
jgi:hypothetical protein